MSDDSAKVKVRNEGITVLRDGNGPEDKKFECVPASYEAIPIIHVALRSRVCIVLITFVSV